MFSRRTQKSAEYDRFRCHTRWGGNLHRKRLLFTKFATPHTNIQQFWALYNKPPRNCTLSAAPYLAFEELPYLCLHLPLTGRYSEDIARPHPFFRSIIKIPAAACARSADGKTMLNRYSVAFWAIHVPCGYDEQPAQVPSQTRSVQEQWPRRQWSRSQ